MTTEPTSKSLIVWPGNSADCRWASDLNHMCRRRDGRLIRPGEPCHKEAAAQLAEQAAEEVNA